MDRPCITGEVNRGQLIAGLNDPLGLAVSDNVLFVANINIGTVGEYDATTGAAINATFITGLNIPVGIAVKSTK